MHSAGPIKPSSVRDPNTQVREDDAWRAEMASRVSNYRRRRKGGAEDSPSLDFGTVPEAAAPVPQDVPQIASKDAPLQPPISTSYVPSARVSERRVSAPPTHNAFDTNYYRRLNAESMAQIPTMFMGATTAATAHVQELETDFEAESYNDSATIEEAVEETDGSPALDFELRPEVASDAVLEQYRIAEPAPQPHPAEQAAPPAAQSAPQGNLIVFRRPLLEPPLLPTPSRDELAEPMHNRPRILEVPEDIMPAVQGSLFPEIRLDAEDDQEASSSREPGIAMPLMVAPVSERLMAGLTDIGVVLVAGLLFVGIACRALPDIPHTKPFWMTLGAVTVLLWAVYQHLFLLYAGQTPGMSFRKIRLSTFDGRVPEWKERVCRARFVFVSCASVVLGFLWALIDEDELCWHDRISQTFPTNQ